MADRFPSPFEIEAPDGAEGWQDLYSYSAVFSEERRDYEDAGFWFHDGVHWPEALTPWDAHVFEVAIASLGQYNTRHYLVPPAYGVDFRILNGYVFLSPVPAPEADIEARVPHFMERAGFYFANWDRLYDDWLVKVRALVQQMTELDFSALPEMEDLDVITSGAGRGSGDRLLSTYHRLLDHVVTLWQYHFEFLNLGYAAYLDFFGFCKAAFPSIPDLAIAKMVAGVDVDLFKPDDHLKSLARLAVSSGIDSHFDGGSPEDVWASRDRRGRPCLDRRVGQGRRALVQLLHRLRLLPLRQDLDPERRGAVGLHHRLHRQGEARASTSTDRSRRCTPSATGSCRSTASCSTPTRTAPPSTASSASRAPSSPTSRTTTSTSSTGRTR